MKNQEDEAAYATKTQFIRRNMREEYISDLIDGDEIVVQVFSDGHSHGDRLVLSAFACQ